MTEYVDNLQSTHTVNYYTVNETRTLYCKPVLYLTMEYLHLGFIALAFGTPAIRIFLGPYSFSLQAARTKQYQSITTMGVVKETITPGDGTTFPQTGDNLSMHYQLSRPTGSCCFCLHWLWAGSEAAGSSYLRFALGDCFADGSPIRFWGIATLT